MIRATATPVGLTVTLDGTRYTAPDWETLCLAFEALGVPDQPWEVRRESGKLLRSGRSLYAVLP